LSKSDLTSIVVVLLLLSSCKHTAPVSYIGPGAPPAGVYRCWAGGFAHLPAGTLTLTGTGHYESYRPHGGGEYVFSPANSMIEFLNGDYNYWEYHGIFQPAPQSADHRERIVLKPLDAAVPIGAERPGEYQYCYRESAPNTKDD